MWGKILNGQVPLTGKVQRKILFGRLQPFHLVSKTTVLVGLRLPWASGSWDRHTRTGEEGQVSVTVCWRAKGCWRERGNGRGERTALYKTGQHQMLNTTYLQSRQNSKGQGQTRYSIRLDDPSLECLSGQSR